MTAATKEKKEAVPKNGEPVNFKKLDKKTRKKLRKFLMAQIEGGTTGLKYAGIGWYQYTLTQADVVKLNLDANLIESTVEFKIKNVKIGKVQRT